MPLHNIEVRDKTDTPIQSHCQQLPTRAYGYGNITSINYSDIRHSTEEFLRHIQAHIMNGSKACYELEDYEFDGRWAAEELVVSRKVAVRKAMAAAAYTQSLGFKAVR